uniref:Uncharacterized protein n=1 Tax=Octopus bimaculoides TaxID=37653 RepID=A0A0L8GNL2_OCTBM
MSHEYSSLMYNGALTIQSNTLASHLKPFVTLFLLIILSQPVAHKNLIRTLTSIIISATHCRNVERYYKHSPPRHVNK